MSIPISQQEQSLHAQISQANEKIVAMEKKLRALDDELASLLDNRERYRLLEEICLPLEKLSKGGAADLFRNATGSDPEQQILQVRETVAGYKQNVNVIEQQRGILQGNIKDEQAAKHKLSHELDALREEAERLEREYLSERPVREFRYRATTMPWSIQGDDERRFRRILFVILSFAVAFGGAIPVLKPPVENTMGIVVPERIARIIKKKQEAKQEEAKQAAKKAEEKASEKEPEKKPEQIEQKTNENIAEKLPSSETAKPTVAGVPKPRSTVENKGVLAFKNNLAELMEDTSDMKLGADARISSKADRGGSSKASQHSVIVSQATGGGANTATISRQTEGGGSQRIVSEGVKFSHVESVASAGSGGAERPLSKGAGPARTDEEIQIVFDRYKAALYRIYNRELRVNPTLRGNMVLRIVIEPDGRVSACTVKSTDMASASFSSDIVNRVLNFNFGPKEGVPAITILYPIDFLPAN